MSLCQIYIPGTAGVLPARKFYHTKLNGRYRARVVGIHFADNTNQHDHRLIKIKSDCLRMPFGSFTDMLLTGNKPDGSQGTPGGDYPIDLEVMGGGMDIELEASTTYAGGGNDSFLFMILSLQVEKVE